MSHLWLCYQAAAELGPAQLELSEDNWNLELQKRGWLCPLVLLGMVATWQGRGQCPSSVKSEGVILWFPAQGRAV